MFLRKKERDKKQMKEKEVVSIFLFSWVVCVRRYVCMLIYI